MGNQVLCDVLIAVMLFYCGMCLFVIGRPSLAVRLCAGSDKLIHHSYRGRPSKRGKRSQSASKHKRDESYR